MSTRKEPTNHCGICGAARINKTRCCDNWVCELDGVSDCQKNHRKYTLCGHHFEKRHPGHWENCTRCREEVKMTVPKYDFPRDVEEDKPRIKLWPRCGLCDGPPNIKITECCKNWICIDSKKKKCSSNHEKNSICAHHFREGHDGNWRNCEICKTLSKRDSDFELDDPVNLEDKRYKNKCCGLCKDMRIVKTQCCNNWICEKDGSECQINHEKKSRCGNHFKKGHEGDDSENCEVCEEEVGLDQGDEIDFWRSDEEEEEDPRRYLWPRCGICGMPPKLRLTDCCNRWICIKDDGYKCGRDHELESICSYHHKEHGGPGTAWKTCEECVELGKGEYEFKSDEEEAYKDRDYVQRKRKFSGDTETSEEEDSEEEDNDE